MKNLLFGAIICLSLLGSVRAQYVIDTVDPGQRDRFQVSVDSLEYRGGTNVRMIVTLSYLSDSGNTTSLSIGSSWAGNKFTLDSATFSDVAIQAFDFLRFVYYKNSIDSSNQTSNFVFAGVRKKSAGLAASGDFQALVHYYFSSKVWNRADSFSVFPVPFNWGALARASVQFPSDSKRFISISPLPYSRTTIYDPNRPCCVNIMGNIDGNDGVDIGDQTTLIDYLFGSGATIACLDAANVDGSANGAVDMADLVTLTDYLFRGGTLAECQ